VPSNRRLLCVFLTFLHSSSSILLKNLKVPRASTWVNPALICMVNIREFNLYCQIVQLLIKVDISRFIQFFLGFFPGWLLLSNFISLSSFFDFPTLSFRTFLFTFCVSYSISISSYFILISVFFLFSSCVIICFFVSHLFYRFITLYLNFFSSFLLYLFVSTEFAHLFCLFIT
jgi:hypothetical protein